MSYKLMIRIVTEHTYQARDLLSDVLPNVATNNWWIFTICKAKWRLDAFNAPQQTARPVRDTLKVRNKLSADSSCALFTR